MTVTVDSFASNDNASQDEGGGRTYNALGQSFTGDGSTLDSALFRLYKLTGTTGNAYAKVYAHSGTFGTSSVGTGSALATSDAFDVSTLGTGNTDATFTFSGANRITLANGTKYVVVVEFTGGDSTHYIQMRITSTTGHGGNFVRKATSGGAWSAVSSRDATFAVYGADAAAAGSPWHHRLMMGA